MRTPDSLFDPECYGYGDGPDLDRYHPQTWRDLRGAFREWLETADYTTNLPKSSLSARPFPANWKAEFEDWLDARAESAHRDFIEHLEAV